MIDRFLGDAFGVVSSPFWSTVLQCWCSAADTHPKLLDRAVSGAQFLAGGVFECDIAHRQSVVILCLLYRIRCNPVHPFISALSGPHEPVRVTRGARWSHVGTLMLLLAAELRSIARFLFPS